MLDDRVESIIEGIVKSIKSFVKTDKIILFGSRAKSVNDKTADFDIAVEGLRPDIELERKISDEIEKVSGLYKVDIVYTENVDEDFKKIIYQTGRVVYERRA